MIELEPSPNLDRARESLQRSRAKLSRMEAPPPARIVPASSPNPTSPIRATFTPT